MSEEPTQINISTRDDLDELLRVARGIVETGAHRVTFERIDRQRTLPQNASLHLYCKRMAININDAGLSQRTIWDKLRNGFDIPITMEWVKDVFRHVAYKMFKKQSTRDLTTIEIKEVYMAIDQAFLETTGCREEWPTLR